MQITEFAAVFFFVFFNQQLELIFFFFALDCIFTIDENVKTKNTVFNAKFENRANTKSSTSSTEFISLYPMENGRYRPLHVIGQWKDYNCSAFNILISKTCKNRIWIPQKRNA